MGAIPTKKYLEKNTETKTRAHPLLPENIACLQSRDELLGYELGQRNSWHVSWHAIFSQFPEST